MILSKYNIDFNIAFWFNLYEREVCDTISSIQEGGVCNSAVIGQEMEGWRNTENTWNSYFYGSYSIAAYGPYAVVLSSMR